MKKVTWKQHLEALIVGALLIAIGTAVASSVAAQSKSPLKVAPVVSSATSPAALCEPAKSPDAMCTLPLNQGAETKICFGDQHARCFELKAHKLFQSIRGQLAQETVLNTASESAVKSSIDGYAGYLTAKLSAKKNKYNSCMNVVSIEEKTERREFCLSALPKKEADEKTKNLIALLETPSRPPNQSAKMPPAPAKKQ